MLSASDVLTLPAGVRHEPGLLVDEVRGRSFVLNTAGELVVVNEGHDLARAIDRLSRRWQLDPADAERDVLAFAWALNAALLANVRRVGAPHVRLARWLALALRLVPLGIAPPLLRRRHHLETRSGPGAIASTLSGTARHACLVGLLTGIALLPLLAGSGSRGLAAWGAVGVAAAVGVVGHELGHVLGLRGIPAALVTTGLRLSILHPLEGGRRAAIVALLGPSIPAVAAVGLTSLALGTGSALAAAASCPLGAHALTATIAGRDGRVACRS